MEAADRWKQIEDLFHGALKLEPPERDAYLRRACEADHDLLAEVKSLLTNHTESDNLVRDLNVKETVGAIISPRTHLLPGDRVNDYDILRFVGSGSMGEVYLANDLRLSRKVAIKVLPRIYSEDRDLLQRLRSEARTASALNHPNIVTIHAFEEGICGPYIVTEYVEGKALRGLIGHISTPQAVGYAIQVGNALRAAHDAGIIHRDIKPENIIVRNDDYVKVLDFGLAKSLAPAAMRASQAGPNTIPGTLVGTVAYMSPEQLRGESLDTRTDIWSWGILLHELTTGHRPFEAESYGELIACILEHQPVVSSNFVELNSVMARALQKRSTDRYQTIGEALSELSKIPTIKERLPAGTLPNRLRHTSSSRHWMQLTGLLLAVVVLIGLIYKWKGATGAAYRVLSVTRVTRRGDVAAVALSSDAKHIAYAAEEGDSGSVHVVELDTNTDSQRMVYSGHNIGITFSPDGNYLYSVIHKDEMGSLFRTSLFDGKPKEIIRDVDSKISFSPDGKQFAFERFDSTSQQDSILVGNAEGNTTVATKVRFPLVLTGKLDWSSSEQAIMFETRDESAPGGQNIKFGAYFPNDRLIEFGRPSSWIWTGNHLSFSSDRLILAAKGSDRSSDQLYELRWRSGTSTALTHDSTEYDGLSSNRNYDAIAAVQTVTESSLWLLDKDKRTASRPSPPLGNYLGLSWSQGGSLLVGLEINGREKIWRVEKDSGRAQAVTEGAGADRYPEAGEAGQYFVFASNRDGVNHVWRASDSGLHPERLTNSNYLEMDPALSRNGSTVVFVSDRQGIMSLWKVPIQGGDPVNISQAAARHPDISPDGRWIVCDFAEKPGAPLQLTVLSADSGKVRFKFPNLPTSDPDTPDQAKLVRWSSDGRSLLYVSTRNGVSNLWQKPLGGGPSRQLTLFEEGRILNFAPSFDGRFIALIRGKTGGDVVLIHGSLR